VTAISATADDTIGASSFLEKLIIAQLGGNG
jgi:hypothetical protein